ncbi:hypothetical protein [Crocosphaera sp. Alani8]|uniref:hypothetical protein n=1 Tax=Crocosphaera sp. Alani8 TaxID=3038952 RepID=UPI00313E863A
MDKQEIKKSLDDVLPSTIGALVGALPGLVWGPPGAIIGAIIGGAIPPILKVLIEGIIKGNEVLIVDHDSDWRNTHTMEFNKAGFECHSTPYAREALDIFKEHKRIRFVMTEQILFEPYTNDQTRQNYNGLDVATKIYTYANENGRTVRNCFITDAADQMVDGRYLLDLEKKAELFKRDGVINEFYSKGEINNEGRRGYHNIIRYMKKN